MTDAELTAQLRREWAEWDNRVAQILGKALGRPWFKDDQTNFPGATESDGVILVEEDAESLAVVAAGRLEALAAERDAAVGRVAALEAACRRAVRYCAGVNLAGPQAARSELSAALLAGEGGGR